MCLLFSNNFDIFWTKAQDFVFMIIPVLKHYIIKGYEKVTKLHAFFN